MPSGSTNPAGNSRQNFLIGGLKFAITITYVGLFWYVITGIISIPPLLPGGLSTYSQTFSYPLT